MKSRFLIVAVLTFIISNSYGQEYLQWKDHQVVNFYEKLELPEGTLDDEGNPLGYIYVIAEMEGGVYEIEISDGDGDLFEIIDSGYYIKFKPDRGIARYVKGLLVVNGRDWRFYEEE